jgi:hypothetical protein
LHKYDSYQFEQIVGLGLMCLTHISTIFQLYHGGQLYWWKKSLFPYKTTDLPQLKLSYLSSDRHDTTEILWKCALSTLTLTLLFVRIDMNHIYAIYV